MKKNNLKKGFTLIELLVVVAIIGILASVVLASLNSARKKGADAAIKGALSGARAQAELYYDSQSPNTYTGVCTTGSADSGIQDMVTDAAHRLGSTTTVGTGAWSSTSPTAVCHESDTQWAAMVSLDSDGTQGWCVDSNGYSNTATVLASGSFECGS